MELEAINFFKKQKQNNYLKLYLAFHDLDILPFLLKVKALIST